MSSFKSYLRKLLLLTLLSVWLCYSLTGHWSPMLGTTAAMSTLAQSGTWQATAGPPDGLVTALIVKGSTLFVGTEKAGVYRSSNNGNTWLPVSNGMTNRVVHSLVAKGDTLFAGVESGLLFRSVDDGNNWSPVVLGASDQRVSALAANDTTVFAAVYGQGLYRSLNDGISWNRADSDLSDLNITLLATNGNVILAGTNGGSIFRSTSNGGAWVIGSLGFTSNAVTAFARTGDTLYLGTDGGGLFRSANNGQTWNSVAGTGLGSNNRIAALWFNGATLFAGLRSDGVFYSTNDGSTFRPFNVGLTNSDVRGLVAIDTRLFAGTYSGDGVFAYDYGAANCGYALAPTTQAVPAAESTNSIAVTASGTCIWAARSNASWLTITAGATGSGNGTVTYRAATNTGGERSGTLTIAGRNFTVMQVRGCTFTLSATERDFPATGGTASVNVSAATGCTWTAASNVPWIGVTAGNGDGNGVASFNVEPNIGPARTGTLTIAGQTYTVRQANGCTFALSASSQSIAASGGTGNVTLNTGAGCAWTASSNVSWLSVTTSGTGPGLVNFTVAANLGPSRSGTLTIAGQPFTVQQADGCSYTLSANNQNFPASGGSTSVGVTALAGCSWTAVSNANWLSITSGASGNGNGNVNINVAANAGPPRSGTLTIAGQDFTVMQADGCVFALSAASQRFPVGGGNGTVSISAGNGCAWTAVSNANWLTIVSGASGTGNGTINFSVAANPGPERSGTLTIAGQTFTVTQANGCVYVLSSTEQSFSPSGGAGTVGINTTADCPWTASSNVTWLSITSGTSGSGNGTINFSVAPNTGPVRSGSLTIAGLSFTVNQGSGCSFTLSQNGQDFVASGGAGSVEVNTTAGCTWMAVSNVNWLSLTAGANGNGFGRVSFTVAPNTGPMRTGTLTIAGLTFTVMQADGCVYALTAVSQNFTADGGSGSVTLNTVAGCPWTAASDVNWITVTAGASGSGAGTINYSVTSNPSVSSRTGRLLIADQTFTVTQNGLNPLPTLNSLSPNSTGSGGAGFTLAVNGTNFVNGAVLRWNGADRPTTFVSQTLVTAQIPASDVASPGTAVITVFNPAPGGGLSNSLSFTINLTCNYTLQPASQDFSASGGAGSTNVQVTSGCAWVAFSNADWLNISAGSSGNGNGTVNFTVTANPGTSPRSGTLTIAGRTFTVNQLGAYPAPTLASLNPSSVIAGDSGFTLSVRGTNFINLSVVRWNGSDRPTVFVSDTQLTAQIPVSDLANAGTASLSVFTPAPGGGTSNTLPLVINQRCQYVLQPSSQEFTASGGTNSVTITAQSGCAWTASSNESWIVIISGSSGSGNGVVSYAVAANTNPNARTGTLIIAEQTFTVTQVAASPTIGSLNPVNAVVGSSGFTLTVNGTNFINSSVVRWNGSDRPTTFVSSTQLRVQIPASDLVRAGTVNLTVFNPAPGSGTSAAVTYLIGNPLPTLSSLSPSTVEVGTPPLSLIINGTNFVEGAMAILDGNQRAVTFVSNTRLELQLLAGDLTTAGAFEIRVFNPAPGGGTSNERLVFTLNNPRPVLSSLTPNTVIAGSGAFTLVVNGTGFLPNSVVRWNGVNRPTTLNSANPTQLSVQISALDVETASSARITAVNPGPGGGSSNELLLVVAPPVSGNTISGTVTFALNPRPVPNVIVTSANNQTGNADFKNETDGAGRYTLRGLPNGSFTLTPAKSNTRTGLSAYDAALIVQEDARPVKTYSREQITIADVDDDGRVSARDAELISRYIVGLSSTGLTGGWNFDPPNQTQSVNNNQTVQNLNFRARLLGDISGSWQANATLTINAVTPPLVAAARAAGESRWLIHGTGFAPGLTLVLVSPEGGEVRYHAPQISDLTAESFAVTLPSGLRGVWALRVSQTDGAESGWFVVKVE